MLGIGGIMLGVLRVLVSAGGILGGVGNTGGTLAGGTSTGGRTGAGAAGRAGNGVADAGAVAGDSIAGGIGVIGCVGGKTGGLGGVIGAGTGPTACSTHASSTRYPPACRLTNAGCFIPPCMDRALINSGLLSGSSFLSCAAVARRLARVLCGPTSKPVTRTSLNSPV